MRKAFLLITLCLTTLFIVSCKQKQANHIVVSEEQPTVDETDTFIGADTCIELETNIGYTIKKYLDKDGDCRRIDLTFGEKPFVVAGLNLDGVPNFVKYIYNEKGELEGFVQFNNSDFKNFFGRETQEGANDFYRQYDIDDDSTDSIDYQKIMFDMINNKSNDEKYYTRYLFKRDSLDHIIKVYDPIYFNSISTDEDEYIVYEVSESEGFWEESAQPQPEINLVFYIIFESDGKQYIRNKYYGYVDERIYEDETKDEEYTEAVSYPEYKPKK